MPQIQVDQRKMHVLHLVKIINAKGSLFHGSVVVTLENHWSNLAIWFRLRAGMLFITFFFFFFYLNYFCTIIFFCFCFFHLYILEGNFPLTFPDLTVAAMSVTNCIYDFSFSFGYGCC